MAFKGHFHLFGFKKAIESMKASIDNTLADDEQGFEYITTSFRREDHHIIYFTLEKFVDHLTGSGMITIYSMKIEWTSSRLGDFFPLALNTYLQGANNCICMNLSDRNVEYIFDKMKMALEAELCVGCESNVVPKDCMECHACMMGHTEQDDRKHMCGICHEVCRAKIEVTPCCFQYIHKVCSKKWKGSCPFCRRAR